MILVALWAPGCSCNGTDCGPGTVKEGGSCVPGGPDGGFGECGPGTVPGEDGCVPAQNPADRRPCDAPFGPVSENDPNAIFVDASYEGGDSDGSVDRPFSEIADAVVAATEGDVIGVTAGTYAGGFTIDKPLTIEGRCARDVVVEGTVAVEQTGDVAVRGFTVTMGEPGVSALNVQPIEAEAGLELRYVFLTMNAGAGLVVESSDVLLLDSQVERTSQVENTERLAGSGIVILDGSKFDGRLSVTSMNGFIGIDGPDFLGDVVPTAATAPSEIRLEEMDVLGNAGGGVRAGFAPGECDGLPPAGDPGLTVLGSNVSNNGGHGIAAACRRLRVSGSMLMTNGQHGVRGVFAPATLSGNMLSGRSEATESVGVSLESSPAVVSGNGLSGFNAGGVRVVGTASAAVSGNVLSGNGVGGVYLEDVFEANVQGNEVSGTQPIRQEEDGHGIEVVLNDPPAALPFFTSVRDNVVRDNGGAGINVSGFDAARDIDEILYVVSGNELDGNGFHSINIQLAGGGEVSNNVITDGAGYGIRALDVAPGQSEARVYILKNSIDGIVGTGKDPAIHGDCVLLSNSHMTVSNNAVMNCERYGIYAVDGSSGSVDDDNSVSGTGQGDFAASGSSGTAFPGGLPSAGGEESDNQPL